MENVSTKIFYAPTCMEDFIGFQTVTDLHEVHMGFK